MQLVKGYKAWLHASNTTKMWERGHTHIVRMPSNICYWWIVSFPDEFTDPPITEHILITAPEELLKSESRWTNLPSLWYVTISFLSKFTQHVSNLLISNPSLHSRMRNSWSNCERNIWFIYVATALLSKSLLVLSKIYSRNEPVQQHQPCQNTICSSSRYSRLTSPFWPSYVLPQLHKVHPRVPHTQKQPRSTSSRQCLANAHNQI